MPPPLPGRWIRYCMIFRTFLTLLGWLFYADPLAMFLPLYLNLLIEFVEFPGLDKALFVCFETKEGLCVRAMEIVW